MGNWHYCELHWQASGIVVSEGDRDGRHRRQEYQASETLLALARLGAEGWELVSILASPKGIHEYWYYFKRPA